MTQQYPDIIHNEARQRFELEVDGQLCELAYRRDGNTLLVHHTEVPSALEGRGIAAHIVRQVFDYARDHDLRIVPLCSYVRAWVARHPEVAPLVARR